jgi:hypothetical protein
MKHKPVCKSVVKLLCVDKMRVIQEKLLSLSVRYEGGAGRGNEKGKMEKRKYKRGWSCRKYGSRRYMEARIRGEGEREA